MKPTDVEPGLPLGGPSVQGTASWRRNPGLCFQTRYSALNRVRRQHIALAASARSACSGSADKPSRPSAVEHRPADLVSQPLILQDEFANRIGELFALPTALEPAGALTLASGGRRTRGLDRVGRSTELVCGDMRHRCRLAGSICGVPERLRSALLPQRWQRQPPRGPETS